MTAATSKSPMHEQWRQRGLCCERHNQSAHLERSAFCAVCVCGPFPGHPDEVSKCIVNTDAGRRAHKTPTGGGGWTCEDTVRASILVRMNSEVAVG